MELELTADAAAIAALARLKALTICRTGRPIGRSVKIVWHDSPDRTLLAAGLTLAEQNGVRVLERLIPAADTWLPAQPAPVVAVQDRLPVTLAPMAAFEGRQTVSIHTVGGQPVTITIAKGVLRAVAASQPAIRIRISGVAGSVREAATLIAGVGVVAVPLATLAAEGIALATGQPAAPRHSGPPVLPAGPLSATAALRHSLGHLTDAMLAHAPAAIEAGGGGPEAVHQMRVAVRRARSTLTVFRTAVSPHALDGVAQGLRDLGVRLGPVRDWDVFAGETMPIILRAMPDDVRLGRLMAAVSRRRAQCRAALGTYLGDPTFRLLGIELAWFAAAELCRAPDDAAGKEPIPPPLTEFAAPVLRHRWKKLVEAGKRIGALDIPSLHAVRLRAKRARYAAELFLPLYPGKAPRRFIQRLSVLQQRLGVLNDGAVAAHLLTDLGGAPGRHAYAIGVVTGFLAARGMAMRPRIVSAFEKFRRLPAFWE